LLYLVTGVMLLMYMYVELRCDLVTRMQVVWVITVRTLDVAMFCVESGNKCECTKDQELTDAAAFARGRRFVFTHSVATQHFPG